MIIYRYLLNHMENLSINEKIVYSALVFKALNMSECFINDDETDKGKFSYQKAIIFIRDEIENQGHCFFECKKPNITKLAGSLEMSLPTVRRAVNVLMDKEHMLLIVTKNNDDEECYSIQIPTELIGQYHLDLPEKTNISGMLLIFYAYLHNRSKDYNMTVNIKDEHICKDLGINENYMYRLIYELIKAGKATKVSTHKLKIK